MIDPKRDQADAAARDAAALQADFHTYISGLTDRVRDRTATPEQTPPAVAALIERFNQRNQAGLLACRHLHDQPLQPTFWLAFVPDRVSCLRCVPRLMDDVGPTLDDVCDLCGRHDDDLTAIWGTLDRISFRAYLCERCHPTGL